MSLPKWPQMIVTGKSVTIEQAKDIILRTDRFLTCATEYSGGNYHEFNVAYRKDAGLIGKEYGHTQLLREALGFVETSYVSNDWASSCFAWGPHGWCSPTGEIYYVDNVGKWPSVEDIVKDWENLVLAFPYLDLNVTLMDKESCDYDDCSNPIVNIKVAEGKVTPLPPDLSVHGDKKLYRVDYEETLRKVTRKEISELGLPSEWYTDYAARIKNILKGITL